jgi:hypothetical protein
VYDEQDPASLLAGMEMAEKIAGDPNGPAERPVAVTPAEACAADPGDTSCRACVKTHCCAERIACIEDTACSCVNPPRGEASSAKKACIKDNCPQCPSPKLEPTP